MTVCAGGLCSVNWQHRGDAILQSLHAGPLPDQAYTPDLPADIRQARTGVPAIDTAVRTLYATGTLHNHARMWLASYVVHLRKVHWRAGADWMVAHLLDGDLASNHLSWQWVAGTGSSKPYLFNADNVARYAPAPWHSSGSVIDQGYEALDAIARSPRPVQTAPQGDGVEEPVLRSAPPGLPAARPHAADRADGAEAAEAADAAEAAEVAGRDVWLVHPWALGEPPADLPPNCLRVGLWPMQHHGVWPWSPARWDFVGRRMAELAPRRWHADRQTLAQALAGARTVQTLADPHLGLHTGSHTGLHTGPHVSAHVSAHLHLPATVIQRAPPRLFADVDRPCASFSTWWTRTTHNVTALRDLPGLAALAAMGAAGPLFELTGAAPVDPVSDRPAS